MKYRIDWCSRASLMRDGEEAEWYPIESEPLFLDAMLALCAAADLTEMSEHYEYRVQSLEE